METSRDLEMGERTIKPILLSIPQPTQEISLETKRGYSI
jgi:hypothetical protein